MEPRSHGISETERVWMDMIESTPLELALFDHVPLMQRVCPAALTPDYHVSTLRFPPIRSPAVVT